MRRHVRVMSACLTAALLAVPALAAEGRIPLWEPTALLGPGTDGKYIATRNISAPGGGSAIFVSGTGFEEIDIDLDGKTLFGDPGGAGTIVEVSDVRTLVLRNGSLRALGPPAGGDSVRITNVQKVIIEDLRIEDGGVGIRLEGVPTFAIRRNIILGADPFGITADGGGGPVPISGFIVQNLVKDAADVGIWVLNNHSSVSVDQNRVDRTFGGPGIWVQFGNACKVAENTVEESGTDGILLEAVKGCKIYNNVTAVNQGNGISAQITSESLFLDNVATNNARSGIEVAGERNQIDRNQLSLNTCYGLWLLGRDNTYGRNTARANAGAAVCGGPCGVAPLAACPFAGGSSPPDLCVDAAGNTSFCDNLMPGPPLE